MPDFESDSSTSKASKTTKCQQMSTHITPSTSQTTICKRNTVMKHKRIQTTVATKTRGIYIYTTYDGL